MCLILCVSILNRHPGINNPSHLSAPVSKLDYLLPLFTFVLDHSLFLHLKGEKNEDQKVFSCIALPIKDETDSVIGVVQVMNKTNGKPFDEGDVNNLEVSDLI